MKRSRAMTRVYAAQIDVALAGSRLRRDWTPWRDGLRRHRAAAIVAGGFASGAALVVLPVRWWGGACAMFGKLAAGVARSSLMPALVGAAIAHLRGPAESNAASPHEDVSPQEVA